MDLSDYWSTCDGFRAAIQTVFERDIISHPDRLAEYDKVMGYAKQAMEMRGIDLSDPAQRYMVATTIVWMSHVVAGLMSSQACADNHLLFHVQEAIMWPSYLVHELSVDIPIPAKETNELDLP